MNGLESCCFWFGRRQQTGSATVEAIVIPRQRNKSGHYHIEADAMLRVGDVARGREWKNLAQVHSHPGTNVRHSGYDDEMANSRRALSLIFPNYGMVPARWRFRGRLWRLWPGTFPREVGVHAFIEGKWTFLNPTEIGAALRLMPVPKPVLIDLRS